MDLTKIYNAIRSHDIFDFTNTRMSREYVKEDEKIKERENLTSACRAKYKEIYGKDAYFFPGDDCPVCGSVCHDDSEYVDVGVGMVKVTYSMLCPFCGAQGSNSGEKIIWTDIHYNNIDRIT